jgi:hypothetical protein
MLGILHASAGPEPAADETPTIPGRDSRFWRFSPWQDGHSGVRAAVTNASNGVAQSRHWYSKIGMAPL